MSAVAVHPATPDPHHHQPVYSVRSLHHSSFHSFPPRLSQYLSLLPSHSLSILSLIHSLILSASLSVALSLSRTLVCSFAPRLLFRSPSRPFSFLSAHNISIVLLTNKRPLRTVVDNISRFSLAFSDILVLVGAQYLYRFAYKQAPFEDSRCQHLSHTYSIAQRTNGAGVMGGGADLHRWCLPI